MTTFLTFLPPSAQPTGAAMRRWLALDGVVTGMNAVAYVWLAQPLERLLGPSPRTFMIVGLSLLVFTGVVAWEASRRPPRRSAVLGIAVTNAVWAFTSLVVAATGSLAVNGWGRAWVVAQAVVVATFAGAQAAACGRREPGMAQ